MLVLRTNGKMACVTEKSAERTGWEIIDVEEQTTKLITKTIDNTISTNGEETDILSSTIIEGDVPTRFSMTYPETIIVDEPFEIKVEYDYIDENGIALENPMRQKIDLVIDDKVELLSIESDNSPIEKLDGSIGYEVEYTFGGYFGLYTYDAIHPNDGSEKQNLTFTFKTIEPAYVKNGIYISLIGV